MKEKRYFCDFWSGEVSKKEEILIILLSLIFITFMSIIGMNSIHILQKHIIILMKLLIMLLKMELALIYQKYQMT